MAKTSGNKDFYQTPGGIATPVQQFASDAGLGTPPRAGEYGPQADTPLPGSSPVRGNSSAYNSFLSNNLRGKKGGK